MRLPGKVSESIVRLNPGLFGVAMNQQAQDTKANDLEDAQPGDERELHDQLERWLRVHEKGPIPYVHSRMDRKPTIRPAWPDFSVFFNERACCVEFKVGDNKLTVDQEKLHGELWRANVPVKTCYTFLEAREFLKERLGL